MTVSDRANILVENYNLNPVFAMRVASETEDVTPEIISQILKDKPKPFVKWVGGKRQLLAQFRDRGLYPPASFDPTKNTYFEPFVGGGAVFFDLLPLKASINDINDELITTYKTIRDDVEGLITELTSGGYIYDKDIFLNIRALKTDDLPDLKRSARFIYLNRSAFNGMYRVNKSGQFNVPFGRYDNPQICDETNLRRVSHILKNTKIENGSYKYVLNQAKKGDFIYFDPPYYPVSKTASFTAYSNDIFLQREQEELRDAFLELHSKGCFVMLSNSDTPFIESLFMPHQKNGITIHKVQAGRNINSDSKKRGKIQEILLTNYARS
jgi:DNA adenine methylase